MASKNDRYTKNVSDKFVKMERSGDEVYGKLVARSVQMMPGGEVGRYTVENGEGRFTFLGSVQIDHLLADKRLGYDFKLVFTGTEPSAAGHDVKQFQLFEAA